MTMPGTGSRGASLIEVLVALLLAGAGALSAFALQASATRSAQESILRSEASRMAADFAARVHANPAALEAYLALRELGGGRAGAQPPSCDEASPCTPAQLAALDRWQWEQALDGDAGGLPAAVACVTRRGPRIALTLAWLGTSPLPESPEPCGAGLYGDEAHGGSYRRTLTLEFPP